MAERVERGLRSLAFTPFDHDARRYAGGGEDPCERPADGPPAVCEVVRYRLHDKSAPVLGWRLGEHPREFGMEGNRDGAACEVASRLVRDDLHYGRFEVHRVPSEAAAVAEPHPRVDRQREKHPPLPAAFRRRKKEPTHLVERQFAPRVAIAGSEADAVPRIVGTAVHLKNDAEHLPEQADAEVTRHGGMSALEEAKILLRDPPRHIFQLPYFGMRLVNPHREVQPCPILRLSGGRGEAGSGDGRLVPWPCLQQRRALKRPFPSALRKNDKLGE